MIIERATLIRSAAPQDADAVWGIFRAVVADGDTDAFDPQMPRPEALAHWFAERARTHVAKRGVSSTPTCCGHPTGGFVDVHIMYRSLTE